jgi:hypothetical protein
MRSTEALQGSCLLSHRNLRSIKWVSNSPSMSKSPLWQFDTGEDLRFTLI